ncbi:MAG: HVO_0416 family zinc finger protein [Halodesulfurarchaeum sp.]
MATAETPDDGVLDRFLEDKGHHTPSWDRSYNKLQCPECGGLHDPSAVSCEVCGWSP